ncbi:MAG TPA: PEP-CTERM sorting domain-containing protein [Candidatus Acidoferrum sp.]|nr:PEP-CTERM sorting domain-containing protein [Candidatus Acidoferrum sp.]
MKKLFLTLITAALASLPTLAGLPDVVASDNADDLAYAPQPNNGWSAINGGFGYDLWTPLADQVGGGTYMEGVGVNNRQVEGNFSFALYAGGGAYDISRQLVSPITGVGEFDVITRFDVAGLGPNLVNIRAGNNTAAFGAGELLSFGIVNGNQLSVTDGSGFHLLPSGEARGARWSWNVDFNTVADTYTLSVTNQDGGFADVITGNLEPNGNDVDSFAVINSSTGNNMNVIFDVPTFSVPIPEPSSFALLGLGGAAGFAVRRRQ